MGRPSAKPIGIALAALILLAVGFLTGRGDREETVEPTVKPPLIGDSVGSARTESGAVEAAEEMARLITGPDGDPERYRQELLSVAADNWWDRASELAENSIDFVEERYGSDGSISFEPVRYRVTEFSEHAARVELWGVVLGYGSRTDGIEESWVTATIELTWSGSTWKVAGQSSAGGPTPDSLRTEDAVPASRVLQQFEALDGGE